MVCVCAIICAKIRISRAGRREREIPLYMVWAYRVVWGIKERVSGEVEDRGAKEGRCFYDLVQLAMAAVRKCQDESREVGFRKAAAQAGGFHYMRG